MSFAYNTITSAGAALIAQATSSNPIVIVSAMSSATAAESAADLASKTTAFYTGKTGTIFATSATNNVARVIMNFNNQGLNTSQVIKSACILARLESQSDSQAVIMAACSDDNSQITIPEDSTPLVHIHIPINISINTSDQVATIGAQYAALADLERFVSLHSAGDVSTGEAQTILGDKTFSNRAIFNGAVTFNNTINLNSHLNADIISANGIECQLYYLVENNDSDDVLLFAGFEPEYSAGTTGRIGSFSNTGDPDQDNLWNNCIIFDSAGLPDGQTQFSNNSIKISSRGTTNNENCYMMVSNGDGEPTALLYTTFEDDGAIYTNTLSLNPQNIKIGIKNTGIDTSTHNIVVTGENSVLEFKPQENAAWYLGNSSARWLYGYINNVVSHSIESGSISTQTISSATINGASRFVYNVTYLRSAQQIDRETGLTFWTQSNSGSSTFNLDLRKVVKNVVSGMPNGIDDTDRPIGMIGLYIYTGTATATILAGTEVSGDDLRAVALKVSNGSISFVQQGSVGLGGQFYILCNIPVLSTGETALVLAVRNTNT